MDQDEYQIVQRNENSWLVDGQYSVIDFMKYFYIKPEYELSSRFTTVAGLIIHINSVLPAIGDRVVFEGYELEVIDKDGNRIDNVLVTRQD